MAEQHIDNVFPKPSPSAFLSRRRPPFLLNCILQDKHEESHDLGRMPPLNSLFRLTWANTKHDKVFAYEQKAELRTPPYKVVLIKIKMVGGGKVAEQSTP